jgi:hypothetical protein
MFAGMIVGGFDPEARVQASETEIFFSALGWTGGHGMFLTFCRP